MQKLLGGQRWGRMVTQVRTGRGECFWGIGGHKTETPRLTRYGGGERGSENSLVLAWQPLGTSIVHVEDRPLEEPQGFRGMK